ncbi:MerR family transcriptional regulator [Streptomyces sp. NPDC094448]|uniref:MerR family transcriptional regulator n=1 Tax=Streptomyces sp. NPDC094448 TaxID=3366063 RepID=UPI003828D2CA
MLIGEVARQAGVSARMLRHYESLGLVRPAARTGAGYREYSEEDIRRIFHIESLRSLGLSLHEVGRALDDPGFEPSLLVEELTRRTRERIAQETELLTRLRRIGAAEPSGWDDVLQVVALLRGLGSTSAGKRQQAALSAVDEVPVEVLVEAALGEADPHVAGALRWALTHAGGDGAAPLAAGLGSAEAAVRERAVRALAEIPGRAATASLRSALAHDDIVVRRYAALALGERGVDDAVPVLIGMVVEGVNDTEAADALSALASDPGSAERIAAGLTDGLTDGPVGGPARGGAEPSLRLRLAQALAEVPGPTASRALTDLSYDEDRAVALTAGYILRLRNGR